MILRERDNRSSGFGRQNKTCGAGGVCGVLGLNKRLDWIWNWSRLKSRMLVRYWRFNYRYLVSLRRIGDTSSSFLLLNVMLLIDSFKSSFETLEH